MRDAATEAARFILGLSQRLKEAPIIEKKLLLKKVVEGLLVDRERDDVILTLLRLPKIDNPILNAVKNGVVLSSVCPEQGTRLKIHPNQQEFTVISVVSVEALRAV